MQAENALRNTARQLVLKSNSQRLELGHTEHEQHSQELGTQEKSDTSRSKAESSSSVQEGLQAQPNRAFWASPTRSVFCGQLTTVIVARPRTELCHRWSKCLDLEESEQPPMCVS